MRSGRRWPDRKKIFHGKILPAIISSRRSDATRLLRDASRARRRSVNQETDLIRDIRRARRERLRDIVRTAGVRVARSNRLGRVAGLITGRRERARHAAAEIAAG
jgi:hypothetical protein